MKQKIGFIGCGNMAQAMIKGIIKSKIVEPNTLTVSNPTDKKLNDIKNSTGVNTTQDNRKVAKDSDVIIIAVKPNKYFDVIEEIKDFILEDKLIVTIAAGITINQVESAFGKPVKVVRTMPNTPALVGEAMSALCKNSLVNDNDIDIAEKIFEAFGKVEIVDEKQIDAVIAVSGSSPAYVYMFIEALADGAVMNGMKRDMAYKMAAQAVLGSAKMVLETGKHPGQLKDDVCSPSGTTIEAVYSLEMNNFRGTVIDAVNSCVRKAKEMSK